MLHRLPFRRVQFSSARPPHLEDTILWKSKSEVNALIIMYFNFCVASANHSLHSCRCFHNFTLSNRTSLDDHVACTTIAVSVIHTLYYYPCFNGPKSYYNTRCLVPNADSMNSLKYLYLVLFFSSLHFA